MDIYERRRPPPFYSRPIPLSFIVCIVLIFGTIFITFLFGTRPSGTSTRDQVLWELGLTQEALELEQEVERLTFKLNALTEFETKSTMQLAELKRAVTTAKRAKKIVQCEDVEESINFCTSDEEKKTEHMEFLRKSAEEKGIDVSYVDEILKGLDYKGPKIVIKSPEEEE